MKSGKKIFPKEIIEKKGNNLGVGQKYDDRKKRKRF
jgi:hypothetical protein